MLLMHTHSPYSKCQYYIGEYENGSFSPEHHGQLSHLGSGVFGPETLKDGKGRRIFWATVRDAKSHLETGWYSVMTLPWVLTPDENNLVKISPAEELEKLRYAPVAEEDRILAAGGELTLPALSSDCMELALTVTPRGGDKFGIKLLCSPDGGEETVIRYDKAKSAFTVDFRNSSMDKSLTYPGVTAPIPSKKGEPADLSEKNVVTRQTVPYELKNESLELRVFVDKSIIEIFVNGDVCIVQRVYPTRNDSKEVKLFSEDGETLFGKICKWEMDGTNPW
jgi:beta-fructofuranosidase